MVRSADSGVVGEWLRSGSGEGDKGGNAAAVGLSALATTAYALCLAAAYQRGALSLTYPIGRGTAPLLVTLGGWLLLGQAVAPATLLGAAALMAGLALVVAGAGLATL